jgi:hypothetical protein
MVFRFCNSEKVTPFDANNLYRISNEIQTEFKPMRRTIIMEASIPMKTSRPLLAATMVLPPAIKMKLPLQSLYRL